MLAQKLGIEAVYNNFKDYGYTTLVDSMTTANGTVLSDINLSPMALGGLTKGVTVRDHTQAYATLANEGMTSKGRTYSVVRDSTGKVILDNREEHEVKYSESTAAILTNLLTHVVNGPYGTGGAVSFWRNYGVQMAGKTGTTNDKKDVYFSGYTPDLVACCWYGYDNNKVITTAGNCAASLFNSVFNEIYKYYTENGIEYTQKFEVPSSVVTDVQICTLSGKLATDACKNDFYHKNGGMSCVTTAYFNRYDVPTEECDTHIMCLWDKETKARCLDGCNCPEEDLIEVGMRKLTLADRALHGSVPIADAQYIYMEVPDGYVYPTNPDVPFFQNALPEDTNFGISVARAPANRVCLKHLHDDEIIVEDESGDASEEESSEEEEE